MHFKKFHEQNKYLINQQDLWLLGVFYTGNELTLGAFPTRYLHKRQPSIEAIILSRFQTLHHSQGQRAFQACQGQDCEPTQGWNGLQDHHKAAG